MDEHSKIYSFKDLQALFPIGRTKLLRLCKNGTLPVVKIGKSYFSNQELIEKWFRDNSGNEL